MTSRCSSRRRMATLIGATALGSTIAATALAQPAADVPVVDFTIDSAGPSAVPGEIIVKFRGPAAGELFAPQLQTPQLEALLEEDDVDVMAWALGTQPVPDALAGEHMALMQRLDYVTIGPARADRSSADASSQ